MKSEEKVFDLMTQMYSEMKDGFSSVNNRIDDVEKRLEAKIDKTNIIIENDIKPKLEALFDGFKQNSEKLDEIQSEVSRQEEFILRKIK